MTIAIQSIHLKLFLKYLIFIILSVMFFMSISTLFTYKSATDTIDTLTKQLSPEAQERVAKLKLPIDVMERLLLELLAIETTSRLLPDCEQYALIATQSKAYPILQSTSLGDEVSRWIFLNAGEVWKYGQTCCCEDERYPGKIFFRSKDGQVILDDNSLIYQIEFRGKAMEVLIEERIKIYSYPLLPESIFRFSTFGIFLPKPPGNKIYR